MGDPHPSIGPEDPEQPAAAPGSLPVPTTFGGVVALAMGPTRWLWCWQTLVAAAAAVVVAWALDATWGRDLRRAASELPEAAAIHHGRLKWPTGTDGVIFQGNFLGIVVAPTGSRTVGQSSDVTLALEPTLLGVRSIFGWVEVPYPATLEVNLGRLDMSGVVAAWTQPALILVGASVFFGLLVCWTVVGGVYGVLIWLVAAPAGRVAEWKTAWRLASASLLLPGVLMTAAVGLYATRDLGLVGLLVAIPVHLAAGWIYCAGGVARLPRPRRNPFVPDDPPALPSPTPDGNPFGSP